MLFTSDNGLHWLKINGDVDPFSLWLLLDFCDFNPKFGNRYWADSESNGGKYSEWSLFKCSIKLFLCKYSLLHILHQKSLIFRWVVFICILRLYSYIYILMKTYTIEWLESAQFLSKVLVLAHFWVCHFICFSFYKKVSHWTIVEQSIVFWWLNFKVGWAEL